MTKAFAALVWSLAVLALGSAAYTQQSDQPGSPSGGMMGAGPAGGMGDMMKMCMMMHPSIAVDAEAVYIVRGDQVLKLRKSDLTVLATAMLPPMPAMGQGEMSGGPAGRGPSTPPRPAMSQMMQQMRQMQPAQFEKSFLDSMIRHHQGAIDMSRLVSTRATHPELVRFAEKTIEDQGREQQQFASWLKDWYNASATRQPTQMDAAMTQRLRGLTGRDFEIQFMRDMITHHSEAVVMGNDAEQKAVHPEVKAAAAKIVRQQSDEIRQLRQWLSAWYGVTVSAS